MTCTDYPKVFCSVDNLWLSATISPIMKQPFALQASRFIRRRRTTGLEFEVA
jgi:hypothetical protein